MLASDRTALDAIATTAAHARARKSGIASPACTTPRSVSTYGAAAIAPRTVTMTSVCAPVSATTTPATNAVPPAMRARSGGTAAAMSSSVAADSVRLPGAA